jgi:hypothetical protein
VRLRDQRERAQITLSEIAAATKIKALGCSKSSSAGDVSAWPGGIFRRAFLRAYASAIGLSPESVVEEFTQVFPDGARAARGAQTRAAPDAGRRPWRRAVTAVTNVVVALVEAGAIVALALLTARMAAANVWSVCAVIALTYYAVSAACLGRSPGRGSGAWLSARRPTPADGSASARARDLIHLVQRREPPDEQTPEDGARQRRRCARHRTRTPVPRTSFNDHGIW